MLREMRSATSPAVSHTEHIQRLLGARAAHSAVAAAATAEVSTPLSQFPDTPSIYSHAVLSPHVSAGEDSFGYSHSSNLRPVLHSARSALDDPHASSLDLDDDDTYPHPHSPPMSDDEGTDYGQDESPEPRMSMLGPKMRFHSPAPWELEPDPIVEQDEAEDDTRSVISKRSRGLFKADGFAKSFGLKSSGGGRPSLDSSRSSSGKEKKSFETSSSYVSAGGALHALAQASMSSTSLAINASSTIAARSKFPAARARTRTEPATNSPTHVPSPAPSPHSATFPPSGMVSPSDQQHHTRSSSPASSSVFSNPLSRTDTRASSRPSSPSVSGQHEYIHPYANPNVSSPYRESVRLPPVVHAAQRPVVMPASDSAATISGLTIPRSSSPQSSIINGPTASVISSNDSPYQLRRPGGVVQGRTISGPMPVDSATLKTMPSSSSIRSRSRDTKNFTQNHLPTGFAELPASPTFTLISLQEAQAQAKERSRSNTIQSPVPFLQQDPQQRNVMPDHVRTTGNRARARSTSAGGRAKTALQSLTLGSSPSAPSRADADVSPVSQAASASNSGQPRLKHKKSGFMRLFNGKDRDANEPPPVPSLSTAAVTSPSNGPVPATTATSIATRSNWLPQSRVPVPQLAQEDADDKDQPQRNVVHRRNAPALAIVPPSDRDHPSSLYSTTEGNPSRATLIAEPPASAPPGSTTFPSLSLRPVSTVFSAHFAEALGGEFSLDLDADASSNGLSPTSALSPVTPGSSMHSRTTSDAVAIAGVDNESHAVIKSLQAQLMSSRKVWQRQIWELEGQVRDLRAEMEDMRAKEDTGARCAYCGRGGIARNEETVALVPPRKSPLPEAVHHHGVVNRPRARTGTGAHFGGGAT